MMFYEDWLYYGLLTILLEAIIYLGYRLLYLEFRNYQKNKFLKQNPDIAKLVDMAEDADIITDQNVESIPLLAYLIYPKDEDINTQNTCVVTTEARAQEMAEEVCDTIVEIMFYPPNDVESRYHKTERARLKRAEVIYNTFIRDNDE